VHVELLWAGKHIPIRHCSPVFVPLFGKYVDDSTNFSLSLAHGLRGPCVRAKCLRGAFPKNIQCPESSSVIGEAPTGLPSRAALAAVKHISGHRCLSPLRVWLPQYTRKGNSRDATWASTRGCLCPCASKVTANDSPKREGGLIGYGYEDEPISSA